MARGLLLGLVATFFVAWPQTKGQENKSPRDLFLETTAAGQVGPDKAAWHASALNISTESISPWTVRYSVLRRGPNGQFLGVDPYLTIFHSGEQLRIALEANQDIYVSVLQKGSSGNWDMLFPSPAVSSGPDHVTALRALQIPPVPGSGFTLDNHAGQEDIFLIVSRTYLDARPLIASLNNPGGDSPTNGSETQKESHNTVIGDTVRHTGDMGSRDLVFEKSEESAPETSKGTVFYAENSGSPESPQVIHFSLKHVGLENK